MWNGSTISSLAKNSQKWELDMLGNWARFMQDLDGDGVYSESGVDLEQERTHNAANEITELGQTEPSTVSRPFAYDAAGNMTEQTFEDGTAQRAYVHDAWNRLVEIKAAPSGIGSSPEFTIARYEYNPLHWRTVKVADVRKEPSDGPELTQRRVMYYDASWRLIEEHICDDWDDGEQTGADNRAAQNFWGLRYIDDLVCRREDRTSVNGALSSGHPTHTPTEEPHPLANRLTSVGMLLALST